jgi:ribosomal-protein-alanine N-acetyltransferase
MDYTVTEAPKKNYCVRRLCGPNLCALVKLDAAAFERPWDKTQLAEEISHTDAIALGLFWENLLIGALLLRHQVEDWWVFRVMIHPEHRHKGLAKQLMSSGLSTLSEHGFSGKSVRLEVAEDNEAAIKLYLKLGFVIVRQRRAYYPQRDLMAPRITALEMARVIS